MRAPSGCPSPRAIPLLFLSLMPLLSSAEPSWEPAQGYAPATRQTWGGDVGESPPYVQGARDPYAAGGARKGLSSGAKPPSLYEALRRDPVQGHAPSGHIETPVAPPRPDPGRYRFRGDGPLEAVEPASASDYRYRHLTAQERDRGQATSGWRPVTAPGGNRQPRPARPAPPPLPTGRPRVAGPKPSRPTPSCRGRQTRMPRTGSIAIMGWGGAEFPG